MERSRAVSSRKCTGFVCMSSAATLYTPPQMKPAVPATTTSGTPINQTRLRVFGCMYVLPSEPDSNAGHDPGVVDVPRPCATLVRRSAVGTRSEEHTSELQSLMRISYAVFCLKKKNNRQQKKY